MIPNQLSVYLRIASSVSSRFANRISNFVLATDKSIALTIRDALFNGIVWAVPEEFGGSEYYDTKLEGKGYRSGYVSFGLDPTSWEVGGIVGGILIQCNYDENEFKSEEPDTEDPDFQSWKGHSQGGGVIVLDVTACYYNKRLGGGCAVVSDPNIDLGPVHIGKVEFMVDAKEKIIDAGVVNPSLMASSLKNLIKTVLSNTPEEAKSSRRKKQEALPTGNEKTLLKWLIRNERSNVNLSEIEALSRAMSARTETAYGSMLEKNLTFFRRKLWPINMNA